MVEKYFLEAGGIYPICIQYTIAKKELVVGGHISLRESIEHILDALLDLDEPPEIKSRSNKLRMVLELDYRAFRKLTSEMKETGYDLQWTAAFNRAM